jgi:hypothetical protein
MSQPLDSPQGFFEKIQFQLLLPEPALQLRYTPLGARQIVGLRRRRNRARWTSRTP